MRNALGAAFIFAGFHLFAQVQDSTVYEITPFPGQYSLGRTELLKELSTVMNEVKVENIDSIKGRIIAQFILEADSSVSSLKIHKSPDVGLSEAIRRYLEQPQGDWVPGRIDSLQAVRSKMTLIIPYNIPARVFKASDKNVKSAEFEGGIQNFAKFLQKNLRYPKEARKRKIEGKVKMLIVVEKDGSASNIEVIEGHGWGLNEEAVRVIKEARFVPAQKNGVNVRQYMIQVISFSLR